MLFVVVPRELEDGSPTVEIVWQPRPRQWLTVWYASFHTVADRDIVFEEMWDRRDRWQRWGMVAMFAGAKACNALLLEELCL
jgi:hypothetical protein